ncbi:MAG: DNRLRE domain-containing protein [Nitrosopumilus sp.]
MTQTTIERSGIKLLSVMVLAGVVFSGMTFFMLSEGFTSSLLSEKNYQMLCDTGLCFDPSAASFPTGVFIQQNQGFDSAIMDKNNESFSTFRAVKTSTNDIEFTENSAILFSTKDSFVREGLQSSNEGSNKILRIMGTGPTNNRVLVGFDDAQLSNVLSKKSLDSAKLKIFVVDNDGRWESGQRVTVHSLTENWQEGISSNAPFGNFVGIQKGVTWNCSSSDGDCTNWNGGSFEGTVSDSVAISNDISGKWIEFDVTEDIMAYIDGTPNYGWVIMKSDEDSSGRINIAARETQTNIPQLELTFT